MGKTLFHKKDESKGKGYHEKEAAGEGGAEGAGGWRKAEPSRKEGEGRCRVRN